MVNEETLEDNPIVNYSVANLNMNKDIESYKQSHEEIIIFLKTTIKLLENSKDEHMNEDRRKGMLYSSTSMLQMMNMHAEKISAEKKRKGKMKRKKAKELEN